MRHVLLLTLLLVALCALRLTGLATHGLGIDEAWDLAVAAQPLPALWQQFAHPVAGTHTPPPLHHLLLNLLLRLDGAPLLLARGWSALWSVAAALVLLVAGRRLPLPVLLAALLFFVLHPLQQYWGQQTRNYAFLQFCAVSAYALLARLLTVRTRGTALLLAFALAAGLYTHYYFVLVYAAALVVALWQRPWRGDRPCAPLALAFILPALAFLPWTGVLLARAGDTTTVGSVALTSLLQAWRELVILLLGDPLPKSALTIALKYLGLAGAGTLALLALRELRGRAYLAVPVLLPLLIALAVGLFAPLFAARYLFIVHVPLLLLLALPLAGKHRRPAALAAACYALALLHGTAATLHDEYPQADDYRGAAAAITAALQPGDVVTCIAPYAQLPLRHYLHAATYVDEVALPATGSRRLWLVWSHWQYHDPDGSFLAGLRAARPLLAHRAFPGVDLYLFAPAY